MSYKIISFSFIHSFKPNISIEKYLFILRKKKILYKTIFLNVKSVKMAPFV